MAEEAALPQASGPPSSIAPEAKKPESTADALLAPAPEAANEEVKEAPPASNGSTADAAKAEAAPAEGAPAPAETSDAKAAAPAAAEPPVETGPPRPYKLVADSCTMQGRHAKQEDRHVKIPDLTKAAKAFKMPIDHLPQPCALFAVYDGHQGHLCAEFVAKGLHVKLLKKLSADKDSAAWTEERIKTVLKECLEELDNEFLTKFRTSPDGCTAGVVLLTGEQLYVAWVGDSRCVICRRVEEEAVIEPISLTEDHRAMIDAEATRIKEAGGIIVDQGFGALCVAHPGYEEKMREMRRSQALGMGVGGKLPPALPVTRALGDRDFKAVTGKALLIPTPDVACFQLTRRDRCVVLMCDGVSNFLSNEEMLLQMHVAKGPATSPELQAAADCRAACGALVQEAYKRGSQDNLTLILVRFEWEGAEKEEETAKRAAEAPVEESKAEKSKKRRLDVAAAVKAQKVAAYERAVAAEEKEAQTKAVAEADREATRAAVAAELAAETKAAEKRKAAPETKAEEAPAKVAATKPAAAELAKPAEPTPASAVKEAAAPAAAAEEEEEEFFL